MEYSLFRCAECPVDTWKQYPINFHDPGNIQVDIRNYLCYHEVELLPKAIPLIVNSKNNVSVNIGVVLFVT